VPDGYLTPHGAAAITLLAQFDRTLLSPAPGCPDISIYADVDERTLATGAAYAAGFAPGCNVAVAHAPTATDPLFSPPDTVDNNAAMPAMAQALAAALTAPDTASLLSDMQAVLDPHSKRFVAQPETVSLSKKPGNLPKLQGPLAQGASLSEIFLLEYLDGKQAAFGRAGLPQILQLLALHPLAYTVTARPPIIAAATARLLAQRIAAALATGPALTVLVGHDTNQAELGGLLNLHWHLAGYPADDPPPGGGFIFRLLADSAGHQFVTVTYQVQTPEAIRNLKKTPPAMESLPIPACGNSASPTACTLQNFQQLTGP
jgi:4-phytase/acid phosphatase